VAISQLVRTRGVNFSVASLLATIRPLRTKELKVLRQTLRRTDQ